MLAQHIKTVPVIISILLILNAQWSCAQRIKTPIRENEYSLDSSVYEISNFKNKCAEDEDLSTICPPLMKNPYTASNTSLCPTDSMQNARLRLLENKLKGLVLNIDNELCLQYFLIIKLSMQFACGFDYSLLEHAINETHEFKRKQLHFEAYLGVLKKIMSQENCSEVMEIKDLFEVMVSRRNIRHVQNILHALEYFDTVINFVKKLRGKYKQMERMLEEYSSNLTVYMLEQPIFTEFKQLNELVVVFTNKIGNFEHFLQQKNLSGIFITNTSLSSLEIWESFLTKLVKILEIINKGLKKAKLLSAVHHKMEPVFVVLVLIIGLSGNGILILIFIRHKEMQTVQNLILMNLAVTDCLSIIVNLLLHYIRTVSRTWQAGLPACKAYLFTNHLFFALSVYSVVMISFQRFLAVSKWKGYQLSNKVKSISMLLSVWLIGCITGSISAVSGEMYKGWCSISDTYSEILFAVRVIVICVTPTAMISVFSIVSAIRLKHSARNMPGEGMGQEQLKHGRLLTSNVLVALLIIFIISYIPYHLLEFLAINIGDQIGENQLYYLITITYYILFLHTCLNPIALCVMSGKYRNYFKHYLLCQREQSLQNNIPLNTIQTAHIAQVK